MSTATAKVEDLPRLKEQLAQAEADTARANQAADAAHQGVDAVDKTYRGLGHGGRRDEDFGRGADARRTSEERVEESARARGRLPALGTLAEEEAALEAAEAELDEVVEITGRVCDEYPQGLHTVENAAVVVAAFYYTKAKRDSARARVALLRGALDPETITDILGLM